MCVLTISSWVAFLVHHFFFHCQQASEASSLRYSLPIDILPSHTFSCSVRPPMAICHQSSFKLFTAIPSPSSKPKPLHLRCNLSLPSRPPLTSTELELVFTSVKAFAPATVANLGPGFDFLGCTIDGLGDFVCLTLDPQVSPGEISIPEISGDHNSKKLGKNPLVVPKENQSSRCCCWFWVRPRRSTEPFWTTCSFLGDEGGERRGQLHFCWWCLGS